MTENSIMVGPQASDLNINQKGFDLANATKTIQGILEIFRLSTCHEIESSFKSALLDLFPGTLIAFFEINPSGEFIPQFSTTKIDLGTINTGSYGLNPESPSLILTEISKKSNLAPLFKNSAALAAIGQFINGKLSTLLVLENLQVGYFDETCLKIIIPLLEAFLLAQKRINLYEGLERKVERQKLLLDAASEIYQQSNAVEVYQTFLNTLCKSLKIDRAQLDLSTAQSNQGAVDKKEN